MLGRSILYEGIYLKLQANEPIFLTKEVLLILVQYVECSSLEDFQSKYLDGRDFFAPDNSLPQNLQPSEFAKKKLLLLDEAEKEIFLGNLGASISVLHNLINTLEKPKIRHVLTIQNAYLNRILKDKRDHLISHEEFNIQLNNINNSILQLIDEIRSLLS